MAERAGAAPFTQPANAEPAFAKINLTLRVVGKRADGYHDLESLVGFAAVADRVVFRPGPRLELRVRGPSASDAGPLDDNLMLKAARALAARIDGLTLGRFGLVKRLPVGAGFGGGSADAAAALRLLARANGVALGDTRLLEAARVTGADVPVCLYPWTRWMRGIGDILSEPIASPRLPVVLLQPGVSLATKDVFAEYARRATQKSAAPLTEPPPQRKAFAAWLAHQNNDLEEAATILAPAVADGLALLRRAPGCALARMSGSGSGCFGIFVSRAAATLAARNLASQYPAWWISATTLGRAPAADEISAFD